MVHHFRYGLLSHIVSGRVIDRGGMMIRCYSCGMLQWVCNAKHFWVPIFEGMLWGMLIAIPGGILYFWIDRLYGGIFH